LAARCGQRHRDVHDAVLDLDAVNQSEVDEVYRNLGVVALAQHFVDLGFSERG
jgi:hypothetical protein